MRMALLFDIFFAPILFPLPSSGQEWALEETIDIEHTVQASIDQYGNVFMAYRDGHIKSLGGNLKNSHYHASLDQTGIKLLEAWKGIQIFAFYEENQSIARFNRFLNPVETTPISHPDIGYVKMATYAADHTIWLFDQSDFQIKKFDPKRREVQMNIPLELSIGVPSLNVHFMREFQNRLFISDPEVGIFVFDLMGNLVSRLPQLKTNWFGFSGDYLYYPEFDHLVFYQVYDNALYKKELPFTGAELVLLTNKLDKAFMFHGQKLHIYQLPKGFLRE